MAARTRGSGAGVDGAIYFTGLAPHLRAIRH